MDAQADLLEIRCTGRGKPQPEVVIGVDTGIASLRLNNDGVTGPPLVNLLGLIQICASSGTVPGSTASNSSEVFEGPFDPEDPALLRAKTKTYGSGLGADVSDLVAEVVDTTSVEFCPGSPTGPALNLLLAPVLSALGLGSPDGLLDLVEGLLSAALADVVDPLVEPLLEVLGADVVGTKVTVLDVYQPGPVLIKTQERAQP